MHLSRPRTFTFFTASALALSTLSLTAQDAPRLAVPGIPADNAAAPGTPAAPATSTTTIIVPVQAPAPATVVVPAPASAPAGSAPAAPAPSGPPGEGTPGGRGPGPGEFTPGGGGFGPGGGGGFRRRGGPGGMGGEGGAPSALGETIQMDGDKVGLQFPNNPVADILSIYQFLTGITLVKDTSIFEGAQVSLVTQRPVERAEAIKLIEASLLTNGYAIVMEPDGKSARILPARSQQANAVQFSHGVRFYTSPKDLPDGETIVTYFMKLDFLAPADAAQMLSGHVGLSVYGRITPVLTPPGLLLTESSTVVKQLISIREAIDIGDTGSSLVTKFIPVKYAEASTVAQIIQATLTAQAQEKDTKGLNTIRGNAASDNRQDNNQQRSPQPQQPQAIVINGQMMQAVNAMAPKPTAQVVADTRLNQILVISAPDDYTYIASLIAEFDRPLDVAEPYERKLKYASAVDVLSALVDLLQDTSGGATLLPGGGSIQQQRNQPQASSSSQLLTGRNTQNTRGGQVTSTTGAAAADTGTTGATGTGSRPDVIQAPNEDNAPISVLVNKTRIVADPMANAILVMGRKEEIEKVNALLDKLDRKPAQVYLSTVIGKLTLGEGFHLGVDYLSSLTNGNFSASSIVSRNDLLNDTVLNPRAVDDLRNNLITNAFGPAAGLNLYGQIGDRLEIIVNALESTNKFKVISRPNVFALNNKKAVITSGQIIPVPAEQTTFNNGAANGSTTTTVTYRDVVLKLEVVPLINEDGEVSLTISQVNDTVIGTQRVEPNDIPIIGTEQLITSVTVPNGRTIVLGGLISEQKKKDTNGIPFLSRIPGVGNLFKDNQNSAGRSELIIFIQPQVVRDNGALAEASRGEDSRTHIGAEAAQLFPTQVNADKMPIEWEQPKKKGFFSRMFGGSGDSKKIAPSMKK